MPGLGRNDGGIPLLLTSREAGTVAAVIELIDWYRARCNRGPV
jgi:hypothetical protein